MRHSYFGRKLSRTANERSRLLKNLVRDLVLHGQIKTTLAKAKAVQPLAEKIVTKAKKADNASMQVVRKTLTDRTSINILISDAKNRFANRNSGFTRIIKLGKRLGDNSDEVLLSFVDKAIETVDVKPANTEKSQKSQSTQKIGLKKAVKKTKVTISKKGQTKKKV